MKEYTTEEIFNELWKRIEYDANVSEQLATESNELQERIDKAIEYIEKEKKETEDNDCKWVEMATITYIKLWEKLLDILKGEENEN